MTLGEWAEWFSIYGPRPNRANWPKTYPPCLVCQKKSVNFFLFPHFLFKRSPIPTASRDYFANPDPNFFHFLSLILLWQSQFFLKKNILMKYEWARWSRPVIFLGHCLKLAIPGCMLCSFRFEWNIPSVLLGLIPNLFCNVTVKSILDKIFGDWRSIMKYIPCQGWHLLSLFFLEFPCGILKSPATDVGSVQ